MSCSSAWMALHLPLARQDSSVPPLQCSCSHARHARRKVGIRMALPTNERLVWHGGEHTAKLEIGPWRPIVCYQNLLFSVARGARAESRESVVVKKGAITS